MAAFYVTFGQKYRHEPHPVLGDITPDEVVHVEAENYCAARAYVISWLGQEWSDLYDLTDWNLYQSWYPDGVHNVDHVAQH